MEPTAPTPTSPPLAGATRIISPFGARSTALEVLDGISLQGRHAIVTGGAAGLGLETSRALASAGASVTLAVRNLVQGEASATLLRQQFPHSEVAVLQLDLANLASVRRCADTWIQGG
ncbi:MAG: SDR family NAD(P)-dependent oxidoreductase, partial [Rhodoferax sp.]|nr:SDR family NAD(P)-dependent oxidoreductase [Rhodoferax sp.]